MSSLGLLGAMMRTSIAGTRYAVSGTTNSTGEVAIKLNYFVLRTNDMRASKAFYGGLFAGAGLQTTSPSDRMTCWLAEDFAFAIATPLDERPATNGNGTTVGFSVAVKEDVQRVHGLALELGGTCQGAPGQCGPKFSAYVRDLGGNRLCLSD